MIRMGSHNIGDGAPCFITFEAGATIEGFENAERLISYTAEAGADAVKFQFIDPDRLVSDRKLEVTYSVLVDRETGETGTITEPLYDILCRRVLEPDEWRALKRHSDSLGLAFFATANYEDDIDLIVEMGCDSIKISSSDVDHLPFIRQAARTGLCLQLDTGNATIGEIEMAVEVIRDEGNENIIIHQCPSGYPAYLPSINLKMIPTLKQMFPYPIAYSDHSPGWEMDVAAVAMGANLIEKTITLDRTTPSIEHMFSLEPPELEGFIKTIRDVEIAMGESRRSFPLAEAKKRRMGRRSIHVLHDLPAGHVLTDGDLEYRRPGFGIPSPETDKLLGKPLTTAKMAGDRLEWDDIGR